MRSLSRALATTLPAIARRAGLARLSGLSGLTAAGLALLLVISLSAQAPVLTLLSKDGRRTMPLSVVADQELVSLDELASAFQLTVREESGTIAVSYKGKTILVTPDQALASIAGRLVQLPTRPVRAGGRWLVPVEFISRALASVYDTRLELRRPSRLVLVGDVRMPRVTIRHEPLGSSAQLTIDATPRASSTVAQDGSHLIVRFDADALDVVLPTIQSQGFVQAVRLVDTATLSIDLGPRFGSFRSTTEMIDTTTRLVIDVGGPTDNAAAGPAAGAPSTPAPELPNLRRSPIPLATIVIDPGHGGKDTGVKGAGGGLEKDLTLSAARRLKAAIEAQLGVHVILTRDDDRELSLDERAAVANNNKAGLLVSLHVNASPRPTAAGTTIYIASFSEAEHARGAAAPERVGVIGGGMRDISLVPWNVAQVRFLPQSSEAARLLEQRLQQGPVPAVSSANAPLRVLTSANMPALLVEMGFLSNPDQEKQLLNAEFQAAFATAMVDGITRFRDYLASGGGEP